MITNNKQTIQEISGIVNEWQAHTNNEFARNLWEVLKHDGTRSTGHAGLSGTPTVTEADLCSRCSGLALWKPDLRLAGRLSAFLENSESCKLCGLICRSLEGTSSFGQDDEVVIQRNGPTLGIQPGGQTILSFYTDLGPSLHLLV